ncbi:hypothetical protein [Paenibacillus sp. GP183]|uniref:hypothetical protein n=1 Tax=Paenibacillus sp. GP183 TaxID=1882751 RepID=UPI0008966951|nr:hypothetical protein [Paenibacillus sp. GP183]SED15553.1 hypothetical protein SAMN05443246_5942 [Paenibacillus sp. GP183]
MDISKFSRSSKKMPKILSTRVVLTERATITMFDPATGTGTQTGTFVAAGAVNDSGTVTANFQIGTGGILTSPFTLTSSVGTITGFTRAKVIPFPSTTRSFAKGTWTFVNGTGRYAGIRGRGKILATIDFTTREVTIARDGFLNRVFRPQSRQKIMKKKFTR